MSLNWVCLGPRTPKDMSETEWKFFNELIWATMSVGIGYISEQTDVEFCRRANLLRMFDKDIVPDDIKFAHGLRTNVEWMSSLEFAKRRLCEATRESKFPRRGFTLKYPCGSKWVKEMQGKAYSRINEARYQDIVREEEERKAREEKDGAKVQSSSGN